MFELPPALLFLFVMFMFEPFMLPVELVFELPVELVFVWPVELVLALPLVWMVTLALLMVTLALLAFAVLALLALSLLPQAERLGTPANARSAKVLRMDRSPELL